MRQGTNPTRRQKERLTKLRLDPKVWLIVSDLPTRFEIKHRVTGTTRKLELQGGKRIG